MASPPTPKLTPFQRAAGVVGQSNAEFIFTNRDPDQLSTVGDDAWGQVLRQTRTMVSRREDRQARQAERQARQDERNQPPAPEPQPAPQPPAPPPPAPAQAAPVPNRPTTPGATSGGLPVNLSGRTGKTQLRTDSFAQAATTGLQLPR